MLGDAQVNRAHDAAKLGAGFDKIQRRGGGLAVRGAACSLVVDPTQPPLKGLGANRPRFTVPVDVQICVRDSVGCAEQFDIFSGSNVGQHSCLRCLITGPLAIGFLPSLWKIFRHFWRASRWSSWRSLYALPKGGHHRALPKGRVGLAQVYLPQGVIEPKSLIGKLVNVS